MKHVTVSRDPFARSSIVRRKADPGRCFWCGRDGRRWQYGSESDAGRVSWCERLFCSIACLRSFFL